MKRVVYSEAYVREYVPPKFGEKYSISFPRLFIYYKKFGDGEIYDETLVMNLNGRHLAKLHTLSKKKGKFDYFQRESVHKCFKNGFSVFKIIEKEEGDTEELRERLANLKVFDYEGNLLFCKVAAENPKNPRYWITELSGEKLDKQIQKLFGVKLNDEFVDEKIAERNAKKGGEGK